MINYSKIGITEKNDLTKSKAVDNSGSSLLIFNDGFKFQKSVCLSFHNLLMISSDIDHIFAITVEGIDYYCIIYSFSKSAPDDHGFI